MSSPPIPQVTRRRTLLFACATLSLSMGGCRSGVAPPQEGRRLRLVGESTLPHRASFGGTVIGGLSGIDHDVASGEYVLLSDDRSELDPARFYTMSWSRASAGEAPRLTGVTTLLDAGGKAWPSRARAPASAPVPDPEAIRLRPGTDTLLWTSEGDVARGFGPSLYESRRDGSLVREIALPDHFRPDAPARRGTRDNLGPEGLALTPDGRHAWVAMENALVQDGSVPTLASPGGPCRFTRIELRTGKATAQIGYVPDAIPLRPVLPGTYADNGVSEILMIDERRMLVLERAYAVGAGNSLRLYEIDTASASDVLALDALTPDNHRPAPKKLVADFATLGLSRLDNTEGLCWGPDLPNGQRLLIAVSDDNFNPLQVTQFAAFEFTDTP